MFVFRKSGFTSAILPRTFPGHWGCSSTLITVLTLLLSTQFMKWVFWKTCCECWLTCRLQKYTIRWISTNRASSLGRVWTDILRKKYYNNYKRWCNLVLMWHFKCIANEIVYLKINLNEIMKFLMHFSYSKTFVIRMQQGKVHYL